MYFGQMEFVPKAEMAEKAQHDAQEAISSGARDFGITLDGSLASIRNVDAILNQIRGLASSPEFTKETTEGFARIFGSYFGEVLRQALGATWGMERIFSNWVPVMCIGPSEIVFNPLRWAKERIAAEPGRDLWTYYETLVRSIQADEEGDVDGVGSAPESLPDRLYTLRHDQDYFDAGTGEDGRQILMASFLDVLLAIFFDHEGNLLECKERTLPAEPTFHPETGRPISPPEFDAAVEQAMEAWKEQIGFRPMPIRIRRFSLPDYGLGIEDRPDHFVTFLKAPELEEPDEVQRAAAFETIREWD
jgi:hypothetical protein